MEGTTTNSTASSEGLNQSDQRQSGGNANGSSDDGTGDEQQQHRQQESETNENEDKDISSSDKAKPATSTAAASSSSSLSGAVAAGTQPTTTKATPSIAALNVYKRVAIIRGSNDVLTYEEPDGTVKSITDLHLAAVATVSKKLQDDWTKLNGLHNKNQAELRRFDFMPICASQLCNSFFLLVASSFHFSAVPNAIVDITALLDTTSTET